ncbi:MAG: F0F1 ATP synthase subunit beta, partial [Candidatus Aminicenantes bacterium]|nr:F0F1 ATP synthase subunit beta [Candidatus Aminicenantes bacterium]
MVQTKTKPKGKEKIKAKTKDVAKAKTKKKIEEKVGRIVQVIGPVVDIEFKNTELPEIYNAVRV